MGVSGESLWAAPMGNHLYELQNSPWHVRTVNWLDVIEAVHKSADQWPEFVKVHRRSGHRTIHVYILEAGQEWREQILANCNRLGATYEGMDDRMYALDFAPEVNTEPCIAYLETLQKEDLADWRINDFD